VTFQLAADPAAQQRATAAAAAAAAAQRDYRAAFWASHVATHVTPLSGAARASLTGVQSRQLAVLGLLAGASDELEAAAGERRRRAGGKPT
jgi:hypothetical protein